MCVWGGGEEGMYVCVCMVYVHVCVWYNNVSIYIHSVTTYNIDKAGNRA